MIQVSEPRPVGPSSGTTHKRQRNGVLHHERLLFPPPSPRLKRNRRQQCMGATVPAFAAPGDPAVVTFNLTAGTKTASLTAADFTPGSPVISTHAVQNVPGSMQLVADDSTGSNFGWRLASRLQLIWRRGSGTADTGWILPRRISHWSPLTPRPLTQASLQSQAIDLCR